MPIDEITMLLFAKQISDADSQLEQARKSIVGALLIRGIPTTLKHEMENALQVLSGNKAPPPNASGKPILDFGGWLLKLAKSE